ncbi:MAG TPA: phage major capsid protein [Candidatus Rokubacteria bacterium]|nr:phage major capsid protein [Candidatus Rokubacteria bacterium]
MNIITRTKLEAELQEAMVKARAVMTVADKENRELSAEERTSVQAHLDEGKRIKSSIDEMDADEAIRAQIEAMTPKPTDAKKPGAQPANRAAVLSIGAQFVQSEIFKAIQAGQHRKQGFSESIDISAATLTEDAASGGDLVVSDIRPGILAKLQRRILVTDLFSPGTTESNLVEYMEETTFTNAAAARAEGAAAAESTLVFDRKSTAVRSIAHFLPVTAEMLEDVAQAQSYIDGRLKLGLDLAHEDQLLNGDGNAPNLMGVMNHASLHAAQARGADTNADAIFKQIMALATDSFIFPDGVVLNPANWQTIVLAKDGNGVYYGAGPFGAMQAPMIWGLPAAVTPVIVANTSMVGAFKQGAQRFTRRGATLSASNSHSDYFIKRLVAVMAELREALAIYRPGAFGKVTGLN